MSGETSVLRVRVASNCVSEDAGGPVGANDCWKRLFKIRCSSDVPDGYRES